MMGRVPLRMFRQAVLVPMPVLLTLEVRGLVYGLQRGKSPASHVMRRHMIVRCWTSAHVIMSHP